MLAKVLTVGSIAFGAVIVLLACLPAEEVAFRALPKETRPINPEGQWIRADGRQLGLSITRTRRRTWIVESWGGPRMDQSENWCSAVHIGALDGSELTTSSDLELNFEGSLPRKHLGEYSGLFVEFREDRALVSGPESERSGCPLKGVYRRTNVQPGQQLAFPPS